MSDSAHRLATVLSLVSALVLSLVLTLVVGLDGDVASASAEDAPSAAQRAEKLVYDVTWGYSKVAAMRLQVGCGSERYRPAVLVAESQGVADQIHAFNVRLDSFAHPASGRPLEARTAIEEEGVMRRFKTRFATATPGVRVEKTFKERVTHAEYGLPKVGHDLLSWMLDLRRQPMRPDARYRYHVWDGWKLFVLEATVAAREAVWTPSGIRQAHRVDLRRTVLYHAGPDAFRPRSDAEALGTLWIGEDPSRLPVAMDFDAPVGRARVVLAGVTSKACD